ncbi:MAG: cation:proton antiporter subunit C [Gammaproteobacteria bacterium]
MIELFEAAGRAPNFVAFVALFLWGFYIAITHHNLVKKLIGMYLVQTSILLLLASFSAKQGATAPILLPTDGKINAGAYTNPLPHALTLTAIVVQVATLGVSLALVAGIYREYGSLDEEEILKKMG